MLLCFWPLIRTYYWNLTFHFYSLKIGDWGQNYKYNWENTWPNLKFGITNFGLQKDNGTNF